MRCSLLCALLFLPVTPVTGLAQTSAAPSASSRPGPTVREVVHMVLKAARHVDPARVEILVRRARLAGLAPTLKLAADRGLKQDLSSSSGSEAERLGAAVADDFSFDASLSFDLSRLVFAPEEVRLVSVQRWLSGDQRRLVAETVRIYFQRRKLLRQLATSPQEAEELELAIGELEALLDAMTDGAFMRALNAKPPGSQGR